MSSRLSKTLIAAVAMLAAALPGARAACAQGAAEAAFGAAAKYTVKIETTVSLPVDPNDEAGVFTGAGFVVDAVRGWIVTNAHVASRSPARIRVRSREGGWTPARRVYVDPYLDVAVIAAVDRAVLNVATQASLDCDGTPAIGHPVGAFGHPWGLDFTGTRGIVAGAGEHYEAGALLTDAAINDGNSGGPLISLVTGKVVGVNTSALEEKGVQNLNFAVKARYVCRILDLLLAGRDPSPPARSLVFFAGAEQAGALKVARNFMPPGSLALQPGDVITGVAGGARPIDEESEFVDAVRGRLDALELRIERGGREQVLTGRLPRMEKLLDRRAVYASGVVFGQARSFDPSEINFSPIATCYVEDGSIGKSAGFEPCDAVETVDGAPATDLPELYRRLQAAQAAGRAVGVAVKRIAGLKGRSFFEYRELSLPIEALHWVRVEDEGLPANGASASMTPEPR